MENIILGHGQPEALTSSSTKSRRNPSVKDIPGPRTLATSVRFRNLSGNRIEIWYDNGTPAGSFQGELGPGMDSTTNAYVGHVFYFTEKGNRKNELARHTITEDKVFYLVHDHRNPASQQILDKTAQELKYMGDYYERTGIRWRANYGKDGPRPPPVLHMWPAQEVGQTHGIVSRNGYW